MSTVGTTRPHIHVYDSILTPHAKLQIAALMCTWNKEIICSFKDVQMSSDCCLFAIAFATAIVFGQDPGCLLFDQKLMRPHLIKCFEERMFPVKLRERRFGSRVKCRDNILVCCLCRLPKYTNSSWIECCECKEWFHRTCVDVPEHDCTISKDSWYCPLCN